MSWTTMKVVGVVPNVMPGVVRLLDLALGGQLREALGGEDPNTGVKLREGEERRPEGTTIVVPSLG